MNPGASTGRRHGVMASHLATKRRRVASLPTTDDSMCGNRRRAIDLAPSTIPMPEIFVGPVQPQVPVKIECTLCSTDGSSHFCCRRASSSALTKVTSVIGSAGGKNEVPLDWSGIHRSCSECGKLDRNTACENAARRTTVGETPRVDIGTFIDADTTAGELCHRRGDPATVKPAFEGSLEDQLQYGSIKECSCDMAARGLRSGATSEVPKVGNVHCCAQVGDMVALFLLIGEPEAGTSREPEVSPVPNTCPT